MSSTPTPQPQFAGELRDTERLIALWRPAFMPLAARPKSPLRFVLGSFNRRMGPKVWAADAFRQVHTWVQDDTREPRYRNPV